MRQHGGTTTEDAVQSSSWQYVGMIGGLIASVGLGVGYMLHEGLISAPWQEEEKKASSGLAAFGDAGEALGFFASQLDANALTEREIEKRNASHGEPVVEVDVEVENGGVKSVDVIS